MLEKLSEMLKEGGVFSFTRVLILVGYLLFIVVTVYLVTAGKSWTHYDTFAVLTGGGSGSLQAVNKFINSKFNSKPGEIGKCL